MTPLTELVTRPNIDGQATTGQQDRISTIPAEQLALPQDQGGNF